MTTWRERIVAARERGGRFTVEDKDYASGFLKCAVGEAHQAMPLVVVYLDEDVWHRVRPADGELFHLGFQFYWYAVNMDAPNRAEQLLDQIEDRVLQLKREAQP